jgi:DNA polymerase I-like protein with 3'-5' exonuclease and polymerase domains
MKIAVIDKAPSRTDYSKYFDFDFELHHMSSVSMTKLLKKDIDLNIDLDQYDYVILVGSEAAKEYAKITSVTNYAGTLVKDKFIPITNPAMLVFKPEGKPDFDRAVSKIHEYLKGTIANASTIGDYAGINDSGEALDYLKEVLDNGNDFITLDTETTALYPRDGYVIGLSITYKPFQGRFLLADILDERHENLLRKIFDKYEVVFHNMKFDFKMLRYHMKFDFNRNRVHDTMVMHYILDENDSHGLKQLALKYTNFGDYDLELDAFKKHYCTQHGMLEENFTYDLIPFDILSKYASIDTAVTYELYNKFKPIIYKNDKLKWVYENLMLRGTLFLMDMEEIGIPISRERLEAAGKYLDKWIQEAKEEVFSFEQIKQFEKDSGKIFNPNSVQQLRKVLFDYVGLTPTGKLTKTGALSTDAEVLDELSEQHPLPAAILKVRQLGKIQSSYVNKILPEIDKDGRIRTNFNLIFTSSGRLSSSGKFNAQQIIRDDPIIKGCIFAPAGYKIVSQDLATGEMYYAAVLSGDKNLQKVFIDGGDFHSTIAKMVFNLPCDVELVKKLYATMRQSAKAISFGILYGSGPAKVSLTVSKASGEDYPIYKAKEDIDAYFTKFRRLKNWLDERKMFIEANGYTYSFFGRKRRLVNVFSADKGIAAHEVRSGINAEVQSLCSDINLLGAMDATDILKERRIDAHIFMLVHDSIVGLVREDQVDEYCEILKTCTQKDRGCSIPGAPIGVDQDIGQDYSFGKFEEKYRIEDNCLVKNEIK